MKLLILLIVLVCAAVALWYFRDEITGEKLTFEYREEVGARFKAPKWRESVRDATPTNGKLVLKHKKHDARIFYLAWQFASEPPSRDERIAAAREFARALREMTGSRVSVKPQASGVEIAKQKALVYALTFADEAVGPGELYMWHFLPNQQRFFFVIVDDDPAERKRITREFLDSFKPGRHEVEYHASTEGKLAFEAPLGWRIFDENPAQVLYLSPQEEVLLQLDHGTRTSRRTMTKAYAATLADRMIEAAGGKWQSRDVRVVKDPRLDVPVARVRGVAVIEHTEHFYEVRLWISPKTQLLYLAALSAPDQRTLDEFTTIFDHITSEE